MSRGVREEDGGSEGEGVRSESVRDDGVRRRVRDEGVSRRVRDEGVRSVRDEVVGV